MKRSNHSPEATRQLLLEKAAGQIHRHGFQATSLDTILAETGVTKGALYHHFSSKQELGLAVLDEIFRDQVGHEWREGLARTDNPVDDLLALLARKRTSACVNSIECGCPVNNLAQEMASVDETFRLRIEAILQGWRQLIADALERGKRNGTVRENVDSGKAAIFITSLIEGATGAAKNARDPNILKSAIETLESFIHTLRPRVAMRSS
jgi:TetR/AcrR family transcriptional regulator, transcriptional repressor for nem operon